MARRIKPIPDSVHNLLSYDPDTGLIFSKRLNRVVGSTNAHGYIVVSHRGTYYYAHRIAWFLTHGEQPEFIDHINHDKTDNRLCNLRNVSHSRNHLNRTRQGTGVHWSTSKRGHTYVFAQYRRRHLYTGKSVLMAHFHRRMAVVADLPIGIEHH